jgi:O-antigen/teichoic acid export membrane protein
MRSVAALVSLMFVFLGFYTFALWLARGAWMPLILGNRYSEVWSCVAAWAIANVFTNIRIYYSTFLLAKSGFRQLATANVISAVVVLLFTGPLIHFLGVVGSIYSIAAGELILGVASWHQCRVVADGLQAS